MAYPELERCIQVIKKLRDPQGGCPWDLEQTHQTLLKYLIEESYEYIEAVEKNDTQMMQEELGDVLLQILLHSTIAEQAKTFDLEKVAKGLADKIIRRHPHVFENQGHSLSSDQVVERWKEIKEQEKGQEKSHIPTKLMHAPALTTAYKIGLASTKVNFDWSDYHQVMYKVEEEWQELKEELPMMGQHDPKRIEEELGDFLFSVAQLARHLKLDPEATLRAANQKFLKRFHKLEELALAEKKELTSVTSEQMEIWWAMAKEQTRERN